MSAVGENKRWVKSSNCCLLLVLFFGVQQNNRQENTDNFVKADTHFEIKKPISRKNSNWVIT